MPSRAHSDRLKQYLREHGGNPDYKAERYKSRRYGSPWAGSSDPTPNKYGGKCEVCGEQVAAGAGTILKVGDKWKVKHIGECGAGKK